MVACSPRISLSFLLFGLVASLCHLFSSPAAAAQSPLTYKTETFERGEAGCKPKEPGCSYVSFTYPKFTAGTDLKVLNALNAAVQNFLLGRSDGNPAKDFNDWASKEMTKKTGPEKWTFEKKVDVELNRSSVVSLSLFQEDYIKNPFMQPKSWVTLVSFNAQTGTKISLNDLLMGNYQADLTRLGEKSFRMAKKISPQESLAERDFTFKDGKFQLNDNFMVGSNGLVFQFNKYEIAPGMDGPTRFTIPYSELKGLSSANGVLASFVE